MRNCLIATIVFMASGWSYGADLNSLLAQRVERRLIYQSVFDRFHVRSRNDSIQISAIIGKAARSTVLNSPDGNIDLYWITGNTNKKWTLIIGVHEKRRIFMVSAVPSVLPTDLSYAEYPIWVPLDGGRVLWWGWGSRECAIIDVRKVLENTSYGFLTQEGRMPIFKNFDATDPALSSSIQPYKFIRLGSDDSADIALFKNGCKMEIKNGFVYFWVKPDATLQKKP
ncbi:hypothetical protein [Mesoterricola silvestris]|uniref:Uncharacterized protein n=1 Tax=Mesoterricola silvestris TaxID=2927979 RepID=A0AA48GNY8_9BACT|nr:hypothetical protein [Mesoterricola silvestris]BDU74907.1 hypothetical protein METEAL_40810 [Mesoterricola silvestris]